MSLNLWELRSCVRQDMMIDKNWRIWSDSTVDNAINSAISKLIWDVAHIQKYNEKKLVDNNDYTIELYEIHKNCIVLWASYLLFSMPSDARNVEKANFKKVRYLEELRILFQKIIKYEW